MSKIVLGLDLGTTSIGWALVKEDAPNSEIIKLGVRVNPLSTDEITDFEKGNPLSTNANRTLKRGARRRLQRFKLRRAALLEALVKHNIIDPKTVLTEIGKNTTHQTLLLRSKAATEKIDKDAFARILLSLNKKRGYKSSRKTQADTDGTSIDGMGVAKYLYDNNLTPGQYVLELLSQNKKYIPAFYNSDLNEEFKRIWHTQKGFHPILTDELFTEIQGKNKGQTWTILQKHLDLKGISLKGNKTSVTLQKYTFRVKGLTEKLEPEHLAIALQEINNELTKASGLLGAISDRSKILYINKKTVGQYQYEQIINNPHFSLKNQSFYRQDYLDEFETIWEKQAQFHSELTPTLKAEIRDIIIFYQRKLKSQKGLISICEFEKITKEHVEEDGKIKLKTYGPRVIPKSSPLFQEFKVWQSLNNLAFRNKTSNETTTLNEEDKQALFEELNTRGNLKETEILKLCNLSSKIWESNYKEGLPGNVTNASIYNALQIIAIQEGYGHDWKAKTVVEIKEELQAILPEIGIDPAILDFNANLPTNELEKQKSYQFWHLLYATEDDSNTLIAEQDILVYGNSAIGLKKKLVEKFGFKPEHTSTLLAITFQPDYGNLSAKAIKKIIPHLQAGHTYDEACSLAGYNHSHSLNKEEIANRILKDKLSILSKNSLRNPVVEKILNQLVHVVNTIIDTYGKPDEIRIELARELKATAKQRKNLTSNMNSSKKRHEEIRKVLQTEFNIPNPTRNDTIKYKLYQELAFNGYKTLYTNQYIPKEQLFSKEIDIEHIIPQAKLFDDSYSNKTIEYREVNQKKGNLTALDFVLRDYPSEIENYKARIKELVKSNDLLKSKATKLLYEEKDIPADFINRDLGNTQYISKKAKEMLYEVVRNVHTTTGKITDKLREEWDLINVMKELNLPKYRALGLTTLEERKDGNKVEQIVDWTKRNDHRHHAMDALAVAFTTQNHVQYLNNLHASGNNESALYTIKNIITKVYETKNGNKKRKFIAPMDNFREEAKKHLESVLISFKNKNKIVTKNKNITKNKNGIHIQNALTPRGQLHKETIYGSSKKMVITEEKLSAKFDLEKTNQIVNKAYRDAILNRLKENDNDPKKAFTGKNAPSKNPILIAGNPLPEKIKIQFFETQYTIRKDITPDLKVDKVIDGKIRELLTKRLEEHGGNAKKAFVDLENNPIYLNKDANICIKRVTITGVNSVEALHHKRDHFGNFILDENGKKQANSFVSTGNNHHVAIYKDEKSNLQEKVVSFYEAVARVNQNLPVIDKAYNQSLGWEFLFTMKQNEMFVFPSADGSFNPKEVDLLDPNNATLISPNLFRVQKISSKNYLFSHHLETLATTNEDLKNKKELSKLKYYFIQSTNYLNDLIKIRINHLGQIIHVGEY